MKSLPLVISLIAHPVRSPFERFAICSDTHSSSQITKSKPMKCPAPTHPSSSPPNSGSSSSSSVVSTQATTPKTRNLAHGLLNKAATAVHQVVGMVLLLQAREATVVLQAVVLQAVDTVAHPKVAMVVRRQDRVAIQVNSKVDMDDLLRDRQV